MRKANVVRASVTPSRGTGGQRSQRPYAKRARFTRRRAGEDIEGGSEVVPQEPDEFSSEELSEAEQLRAQERFMVMDLGLANCTGCGYQYDRNKGDPDWPISPGITFSQLPADYTCPICGGPKSGFENQTKTIAGFAENQKYGLGTNTMTGDQKLLLIYGSLLVFFGLFLAGYAFD
ncbi:rubredoxin [Chloropicon primus]|uniref:Rubredoxin n=1 Tax=Chloropicon primus TaxID=1764295 RepID=A0A5B8MTL2_9CHLO|nr:rubredoxin [Chloropicon primus]|eukprot:QDZ23666.1 rubredoxin [Chloropicon primus]